MKETEKTNGTSKVKSLESPGEGFLLIKGLRETELLGLALD